MDFLTAGYGWYWSTFKDPLTLWCHRTVHKDSWQETCFTLSVCFHEEKNCTVLFPTEWPSSAPQHENRIERGHFDLSYGGPVLSLLFREGLLLKVWTNLKGRLYLHWHFETHSIYCDGALWFAVNCVHFNYYCALALQFNPTPLHILPGWKM